MKKFIVLGVLFILPIVAYLFFASGINNFAKLPVLTENVDEIGALDELAGAKTDNKTIQDSVKFDGHITILGFMGKDIKEGGGYAFNVHQKIYEYFQGFKDFQFVTVQPLGTEAKVEELRNQLNAITEMDKWHFVFAEESKIKALFTSLNTDLELRPDLGTPYVFIIDKNRRLRGRDDDEEYGTVYGYDTSSVAELGDLMKDDVKIVLAEYRLALKKNTADRQK